MHLYPEELVAYHGGICEQVDIPSALAASTDIPYTENGLSAPSCVDENDATGTAAEDTGDGLADAGSAIGLVFYCSDYGCGGAPPTARYSQPAALAHRR